MSKKIDERFPQDLGKKLYQSYAAIRSPWGKLIDFHDTTHFVMRYTVGISAYVMETLRILIPDYVERSTLMCETFYEEATTLYCALDENGESPIFNLVNIHPFLNGGFIMALSADQGDETGLVPGRVADFGSYRVEKELDVCVWDIVGSEICRAATLLGQGVGDGLAKYTPDGGPLVEFNMVEAIGCGDRHCRLIAENREKYPMPEKEIWQRFGPIATDDYIKYTPEEECITEPMWLRGDNNYVYSGGTNVEIDETMFLMSSTMCSDAMILFPFVREGIKRGIFTKAEFDNTFKCVCEAAGKAAFIEPFAKEGLRRWLNAPSDINDGRLLGGYIEVYLQGMLNQHEVEAFNKDEVILVFDRKEMSPFATPEFVDGLLSYWYGMARTLVGTQWALWEEDSPEGKVRIKIAKKIDKFSR